MSFCCLVLKAPTPVNFLGKLGCLGPSPVTSAPCLGQEDPPHVGAGGRQAPVWASLPPRAVDWGKALVPSLRLYLQSGHNDPFSFKWECQGRLLCILKGLGAPHLASGECRARCGSHYSQRDAFTSARPVLSLSSLVLLTKVLFKKNFSEAPMLTSY